MSSLKIKKSTSITRAHKTRSGPDYTPHRLSSGISTGAAEGQSASYSNEIKDELLAEEADLCKRIDDFFAAMKLLQRAVNKKEDISQLKVEFETK